MGRRVTRVDLEANVSGYVTPVRTARRETNELKRDAEKFARGRYKADIGVETAKARGEMSALEKQLDAFARSDPEARVNLDTDEARDRLRALQARLNEVGREVTEAKATVDDDEAEAKLSRLEASLLAIGKRSAEPDIDLAGVAKAEADLGMLEARLGRFDGKTFEANVRIDGTAQMSKQAGLITDALLAIGPAGVAASATAGGALVALGGSAATAVGGLGTLIGAFQGIPEAVKAINNLKEARAAGQKGTELATEIAEVDQAMADLGKEGQDFVIFIQERLIPGLKDLQKAARQEAFPGIQKGLEIVSEQGPRVERIVRAYASAWGQLGEEAGKALTSPFWDNYFDFLAETGRDSMVRMGRAAGNFAEGLAAIHQAFFPLQRNMEDGILGWSRAFNRWAKSLDETEGFARFMEYVNRVGPKLIDTVAAVAEALLAIAKAAAPIGEASLPIIQALAKAVEVIADSEAGPVLIGIAAGLAAVNRALRVFQATSTAPIFTTFGQMGRSGDQAAAGMRNLRGAARGLAGAGGLGVLAMSLGETNPKLRALEGAVGGALLGFSVAGPPGAVVGGLSGALGTLALTAPEATDALTGYEKQVRQTNKAMKAAIGTLDAMSGKFSEQTRFDIGRTILEAEQFGSLRNLLGKGVNLDDLISLSLMPEKGLRRTEEWKRAVQAAAKALSGLRGEGQSWSEHVRENVIPNLDRWIFGLRNSTEGLRNEHEQLGRTRRALGQQEKQLGQVADKVGLNENKTKQLSQALKDATARSEAMTGKSRLTEEQLRKVAKQLDLSRQETRDLIDAYKDVPPKVRTDAEFKDDKARGKTKDWVEFVQDQWKKLDKITVSAGFFGSQTGHVTHGGGHGQFAAGGLIEGPGSKTSDSVHIRASRGEFMQQAAAVDREGVPAMEALNEGRATIVPLGPGFRDGGLVGGRAATQTLRVAADFSELRQAVREFARSMAMSLRGGWIPGISNQRVQYSGVTLDRYTYDRLRAAERLIGQRADLTQGSFSTSVAASGGTHAGGGAFDADSPFTRAFVVALRKYGVAAWRRYPSQGPWGTHIHGIALGDKIASAAAKQQMRDYLAGGDGLGGRDYEPRPGATLLHRLSGPSTKRIGGGAQSAKRYAFSLFPQYHWDPARQWAPLEKLWTRESNWNYRAINPSSGAGGIPQALPPSKMGPGWRNNPAQQIRWGLGYIHDRYRTPRRAWAHSQRVGWYDGGGPFPNNSIGVNTSGGTEEVLTPLERDAFKELGRWAYMSKVDAVSGGRASGGGRGRGDGPIRVTLDVDGQQIAGVIRGITRDEMADEAAYQAGA